MAAMRPYIESAVAAPSPAMNPARRPSLSVLCTQMRLMGPTGIEIPNPSIKPTMNTYPSSICVRSLDGKGRAFAGLVNHASNSLPAVLSRYA